jgi:hypothetical protein
MSHKKQVRACDFCFRNARSLREVRGRFEGQGTIMVDIYCLHRVSEMGYEVVNP